MLVLLESLELLVLPDLVVTLKISESIVIAISMPQNM